MSPIEIILYIGLGLVMTIWLVLIIRKYRKNKKLKEKGIDPDEEE